MSITLGLVQGLLILLPGFCFYAAIIGVFPRKGMNVDAPSPNSILSVSIIAIGALLAHFFGSAFLVFSDWVGQEFFRGGIPFPDPYKFATDVKSLSATKAFFSLLSVIWLCVVGYVMGLVVLRTPAKKTVHELKYGQFSDLVSTSSTKDRAIFAYVVTNIGKEVPDGESAQCIGYSGVVTNLSHNKNGVNGIFLKDAVPFYFCPSNEQINILPKLSANGPIPTFYIPSGEIRTISLDVIQFGTDEEIESSTDDVENPEV